MNRDTPARVLRSLTLTACAAVLLLGGWQTPAVAMAAAASKSGTTAGQVGRADGAIAVTAPPADTAERGTAVAAADTGTQSKVQRKMTRLRIHVIDGRTMKPLSGAEVVLIENEARYTTDADGYTPWFAAPVLRDPRYRPLVAELHGQLGVIAYKNGYRDSIHLGIRVNEDVKSETTVWMYKLGPGDVRIEPVLYEVPYHHLWLIRLADKFRNASQPGEGPQRP